MLTENEIKELSEKIKNSEEWIAEDCEKLCRAAGLYEEWKNADGETFETVVYNAAKILHVEI